jgi:hypothetical protein
MLLRSLSQSLKFTAIYDNKRLIFVMMNTTTTKFILKNICLASKFDRNLNKIMFIYFS